MHPSGNCNIEKLKDGNKSEFEKIYLDFFDVLYALCFQYAQSKSVAEELVQDAFMKLWEMKEELQDNTNIKNFLFTIARNNSLNYIRSRQIAFKHLTRIKERESYYAAQSLEYLGDNVIEFEELMRMIEKSIEELPAELKEAFTMNRYSDMKYAEIAEKLQVSIKTVEARISRALKILRKELKGYLSVFFLSF